MSVGRRHVALEAAAVALCPGTVDGRREVARQVVGGERRDHQQIWFVLAGGVAGRGSRPLLQLLLSRVRSVVAAVDQPRQQRLLGFGQRTVAAERRAGRREARTAVFRE